MRDFKLVGVVSILFACGGGGGGGGGGTAPTTSASATATPTMTASAAPSASTAGGDDAYDDPNESSAPIAMQPLVTKTTPKTAFPKAKTSDGDCWKTVSFSGKHDTDFPALIDKCGTPTGMLEYVKPANGKLHSVKDAIDSFSVAMNKGACYRLFAVADQSIHDIDIVILRNGAILGTDDMKQPVAIIQGSAPFCPEDDGNYSFDVKVKGEGKGAYTFGIWTRPK
ncbi:MAG TPA: hypothetical protein VGH87_15470 [Polyangiaceae bacterium]|jgi:hypothetical protein